MLFQSETPNNVICNLSLRIRECLGGKSRCRRNRLFVSGMVPAGTPQNWPRPGDGGLGEIEIACLLSGICPRGRAFFEDRHLHNFLGVEIALTLTFCFSGSAMGHFLSNSVFGRSGHSRAAILRSPAHSGRAEI